MPLKLCPTLDSLFAKCLFINWREKHVWVGRSFMLENMILIYHRTCLLHPACSFSRFVIFAILWLGKNMFHPANFPRQSANWSLVQSQENEKHVKSTTEIVCNVVLPCYVCWITTLKLQDYTIRYIYIYYYHKIIVNIVKPKYSNHLFIPFCGILGAPGPRTRRCPGLSATGGVSTDSFTTTAASLVAGVVGQGKIAWGDETKISPAKIWRCLPCKIWTSATTIDRTADFKQISNVENLRLLRRVKIWPTRHDKTGVTIVLLAIQMINQHKSSHPKWRAWFSHFGLIDFVITNVSPTWSRAGQHSTGLWLLACFQKLAV